MDAKTQKAELTRAAIIGAAMDLAHARMIVRCLQHLQNDASMLGEPQAALHAEGFERRQAQRLR